MCNCNDHELIGIIEGTGQVVNMDASGNLQMYGTSTLDTFEYDLQSFEYDLQRLIVQELVAGALDEVCNKINDQIDQLYKAIDNNRHTRRSIDVSGIDNQIEELTKERANLRHLSRAMNMNINAVPEKWRDYVVDYVREKIQCLHRISTTEG